MPPGWSLRDEVIGDPRHRREAQELEPIMAAIAVVLAAIATAAAILGAVFVAWCWGIKRIDKRGTLRQEAPTILGHGVQSLTGTHAARWDWFSAT
jgi:hypothetical protein